MDNCFLFFTGFSLDIPTHDINLLNTVDFDFCLRETYKATSSASHNNKHFGLPCSQTLQ